MSSSTPDESTQRDRIQQVARQHLEAGDPLGWFEAVYALAEGQPSIIPWADLRPHPKLVEFIATHPEWVTGQRALVVGSGLGDDAHALAQAGGRVRGFDLSSTAIDWAKKRFAETGIDFQVANLLELPGEYRQAFDLVVEIFTLQALPLALRGEAVRAVAGCVAPQGRLVVVCRARDHQETPQGPPWALSREELALLEAEGLRLVELADYVDDEDPPQRRFAGVWQRR